MSPPVQLYNTLSRSLEPFIPLAPPTVTLYVCGPTVYDDPHLGHARSAYTFEVLRRTLTQAGYQVRFVRNVTDVDDKIIEKARQEYEPRATSHEPRNLAALCEAVAARYLKSYHAMLERLGIEPPTEEPLATQHVVPDMTDLISKLLVNGVAYEAKGDVYFAVRKFEGYGKLSNRTLDELQAGARVEPGEQKQDPLDFALWKSAKPDEPFWNSPWGKGRPGWHIECSAMSTKYLGDTFDIHGGGVDLVFPHHENEIAQSHAVGKPFARTWIHNGLLTVNGEKMSKSLKNYVTVDDALKRCGGETDALKMFFLGTQYRSPADYTAANLKAAQVRCERLHHFIQFAHNRASGTARASSISPEIVAFQQAFDDAMRDDLNTPRALAALDQLAAFGFQREESRWQSAQVVQTLGQTIGLFERLPLVQLTPELSRRLHEREAARQAKDFHTSDRIRNELALQGLRIEDTPDGPVVLPR